MNDKPVRQGMAERKRQMKQRRAWKEYDEEKEEMEGGLDNPRHILSGRCVGADKTLNKEIHEAVVSLHKTVVAGVKKGKGGGKDVLNVVGRAMACTTAAQQGRKINDNIYEALQQVLGSVLPSWEQGIHGEQPWVKMTKEINQHLSQAQGAVSLLINKATGISAKQFEFVTEREKSRGWMQLVLRAWREKVEWRDNTCAKDTNRSSWKVRMIGDKPSVIARKGAMKKENAEKRQLLIRKKVINIKIELWKKERLRMTRLGHICCGGE